MKNNLKYNANITTKTFTKLINAFFENYEKSTDILTIGLFQKQLKINSKIINKWKQLKDTNNLYLINYNNYIEALDYFIQLTINHTFALSPKSFSHNSFWNYANKYFPKTEQEASPSIVLSFSGVSTHGEQVTAPVIDKAQTQLKS